MFSALRSHARSNVIAYLALFVALGGTGAYAANTIGSSDVINDSLQSEDVKQATLTRGDFAPESITGTYVLDGSLSFFDFAPGTIVNSRLADNAVNSAKVASNALTGGDIDDTSLQNAGLVQVTRQSSGSTSSGTAGSEVAVPLTGGAWSQAAGQVNLFAGEATITSPATCPISTPPFLTGTLTIRVDGEAVRSESLVPTGGTFKHRFAPFPIPRPAAATTRTMTVAIRDNCENSNDFSVSNFKVDTTGVK